MTKITLCNLTVMRANYIRLHFEFRGNSSSVKEAQIRSNFFRCVFKMKTFFSFYYEVSYGFHFRMYIVKYLESFISFLSRFHWRRLSV